MATDPVCGMSVDENTAPAKTDYKGKTYYFCSADCKNKFQAQLRATGTLPETATENRVNVVAVGLYRESGFGRMIALVG